MEYDEIEVDFIERTLELICKYKGNYEVTLLINCCLGLLVLPKEKHLESIPKQKIPTTGSLWGLSRDSVTGVGCEHCGYKLSNVIRRIRNGICHFHVKTLPDGTGEISKIQIKDRGKFKAILSVNGFKELSVSLAEHVIQKVNDERKKLKSEGRPARS